MILTLADYKTITNTTDATYDTLTNSLLTSVDAMIDTYCDRNFDDTRYYQWFHFSSDRLVILPEYPVNQIIYVGYPAKVATIAYTTGNYNIDVTSTGITITNDATFAQDTYTFAANIDLAALKVSIEDDYGPNMTLTIETGYTTMNSLLLRKSNGKVLTGAVRLDSQVQMQDRSDRIMEFAYDSAFVLSYANDYFYNDELFIIWNGGYVYANMPKDLQMICSRIVKDYLNIITGKINPLIKSQTVTNYSVTYVDNAMLSNIVDNYKSQLDGWCKKTLAG